MQKRLSKTECDVLYSKYLHSRQPLPDFCKENAIPYMEFTNHVNNWENRHGVGMVEEAMERMELTGYSPVFDSDKMPARGESLFKELAIEKDDNRFRSKRFFPENPYFAAELTAPVPGTIVREASLVFPSGVEISFPEATIKSLILAVVLYEEFDTWAGQ